MRTALSSLVVLPALLLSLSPVLATPSPAPPAIEQLLQRQAQAFDRAALLKSQRAVRAKEDEQDSLIRPKGKRHEEKRDSMASHNDPSVHRARAATHAPLAKRMHHGVPHSSSSDDDDDPPCHHQGGMKRVRSWTGAASSPELDERAPVGEQYPYAANSWTSAPLYAPPAATSVPVATDRASAYLDSLAAAGSNLVVPASVPLAVAQKHYPAAYYPSSSSPSYSNPATTTEEYPQQAIPASYPLAPAPVVYPPTSTAAVAAPSLVPIVSNSSSSSSDSTPSTSTSTAPLSGYFYGASSYYIHALPTTERLAILDALVEGGFSTVRVFIASVYAGNKGSNNIKVDDLEPNQIGTYDDTILTLVDQLMLECSSRGLKLVIALSDRYALGFWSTDAYALQLKIVKPSTSGAQQVSDAKTFYTDSGAIKSFESRLKHIMEHVNDKMGGKKWKELSGVVYAFEPQNEPQGHMSLVSPSWSCDRSSYLRSLLPASSPILISSGGGIDLATSLGSWATSCSSIDVISVHDYGTDPKNTVPALVKARDGVAKGKVVMLEAGMPWMVWEVVKPGKGESDFEIWTDEPAWGALVANTTATPAPTQHTVTPAQATTQQQQAKPSASAWLSQAKQYGKGS
ncbi:hypothetical protein RQP46_005600 [Phenoliferia psychrophenolica]